MASESGYKDSYPALILDLMQKGKKGAEVHAALGIHRKTFWEWRKKYPELEEAYQKGMDECEKWWCEFGRQKMVEGDEKGFKYWKEFMHNNFAWGKQLQAGNTVNINQMTVNNGQTKEELIAYIESSLKELPIIDVEFTANPALDEAQFPSYSQKDCIPFDFQEEKKLIENKDGSKQ